MTDDGSVRVEDREGIAVVRIDRPPANALDIALLEEGAAMQARLLEERPAAVVLTGRDGFFSAGVDLKLAPTLDAVGQRDMVAGINRLFAAWYSFPRPVVAAVNGHAIAGGLILALCGDYRVCATQGRFGLTELRAGIPYPAVAMAVVRAELSPRAARLLVLGADLVDAKRMLELGVVDELAEPDDVLTRALDLARELAALPAGAYETVKRQLRGAAIESMERVVAGAEDPLAAAWLGAETAEAAAATLRGGHGG